MRGRACRSASQRRLRRTLGRSRPKSPRNRLSEPPSREQPKPAAIDAVPLPQIASNKPGTPAPAANRRRPRDRRHQTSACHGTAEIHDGTARSRPPTDRDCQEPTKTAANAVPAPVAVPPAPAVDANAAAAPAKDAEKPELDADATNDAEKSTIQRTEFAVDLGGANSIGGLRALWRGLLKSQQQRSWPSCGRSSCCARAIPGLACSCGWPPARCTTRPRPRRSAPR